MRIEWLAMRDVTEEVKDGVVRDYLRGDKTRVTQLKYKIRPGVMYPILRARKVKLRKVAPVRRDEVVKLRKGGLSYAEIGRRLGISRERVRQIVNPKPAPKKAVPQFVPKHPVFHKYNRGYLAQVTGYSKGYLCRVATGRLPLSQFFIERCCFKLGLPEAELFVGKADVTGNEKSVTRRGPKGVAQQERYNILRLTAEGYNRHEIARTLFISEGTVRTARALIRKELGAKNIIEALAIAFRKGVLTVRIQASGKDTPSSA